MCAIPDIPAFAAFQDSGKEFPIGLTAPIPVTTTRYIVSYNSTGCSPNPFDLLPFRISCGMINKISFLYRRVIGRGNI
jgi:hypothetical protein